MPGRKGRGWKITDKVTISSSESGTVTVVVPVYNTAAYLDRCVESLLGQSYGDLEILLIDDGSTDESPSLCDAWAARDRRIRVIHKENAGLGMARNTGIEAATGKAICFVDSDDHLLPQTIELAYGKLLREQVQAVIFGMVWEKEGKKEITSPKTVYRRPQVRQELLPNLLCQQGGLPISSCAGLYSMDLVRKIRWRFPSERQIIAEDVYALLGLYAGAESAAVMQDALYVYCCREDSLTRSYRQDRFGKLKECYIACRERCREENLPEEVLRSCAAPFLGLLIGCMKQEARQKNHAAVDSILRDPLVRQALRENTERPGWKKRLFFFAMTHFPWAVWPMLRLQRLLAGGGNLG